MGLCVGVWSGVHACWSSGGATADPGAESAAIVRERHDVTGNTAPCPKSGDVPVERDAERREADGAAVAAIRGETGAPSGASGLSESRGEGTAEAAALHCAEHCDGHCIGRSGQAAAAPAGGGRSSATQGCEGCLSSTSDGTASIIREDVGRTG
mmetsp:Transcript_8652/g.24329  ORF Transcript_8652/g.24329 Transcript_8652/m.24329 type:complete len:154 (+) Transcript_8652:1365-1826(+)